MQTDNATYLCAKRHVHRTAAKPVSTPAVTAHMYKCYMLAGLLQTCMSVYHKHQMWQPVARSFILISADTPNDHPVSYSTTVADAMAAGEATGCGAVHCPERLVPRLRRRGDYLHSPFIPSRCRVFRPWRQNWPCLELAATTQWDLPRFSTVARQIPGHNSKSEHAPQPPSRRATDPLVSETQTLNKPKLFPQLLAAQVLHATT